MPVSPDIDTFRDVPTTIAHGAIAAKALLPTPAQVVLRSGIRTTTLYGWLIATRGGALVLHGEPFSLRFRQTEVERLRTHKNVQPRPVIRRPPSVHLFAGIRVPLGPPTPGGG